MDYNELINQILKQKDHSTLRKASIADIGNKEFKNISLKEEKLKSYRIQGEYGEKKFIKP